VHAFSSKRRRIIGAQLSNEKEEEIPSPLKNINHLPRSVVYRIMPLISSGDWECPKCHSHRIALAKASKKSAKMVCEDCGYKGSAMDF
jgi:predicted RNA-binding Zn-ribbon protein involved in translation (DUF1610 family)